jgi:hypothetical protein
MKLTGRFWGTDTETGKINEADFETYDITEKQLRDYLWVFDHRMKKSDVIPKYLFNFPV